MVMSQIVSDHPYQVVLTAVVQCTLSRKHRGEVHLGLETLCGKGVASELVVLGQAILGILVEIVVFGLVEFQEIPT